jgi:hypothetical protein
MSKIMILFVCEVRQATPTWKKATNNKSEAVFVLIKKRNERLDRKKKEDTTPQRYQINQTWANTSLIYFCRNMWREELTEKKNIYVLSQKTAKHRTSASNKEFGYVLLRGRSQRHLENLRRHRTVEDVSSHVSSFTGRSLRT